MESAQHFWQLCPSRSLRFVWSLNWACRRQLSSIGQLHDNDWLQLPEFGFALLFKFVNPAGEWRTIALICTRKQQTQGQSGSCNKMTSSCNCPIHQETHLNDTRRPEKNSTKKKKSSRERSVTTENERQKFVLEIPDKGLHTRHCLVI